MDKFISMSHGSGGKKTSKLINELILKNLGNDILNKLEDGALLKSPGNIAFSTDSFVIDPYFFPGGDIGKLSVCGTVNDLIMCGSIPKYLSLSLILEEGFNIEYIEKIIESISSTCKKAGVHVVTGDTKVVDRGHGHGIYINTSGIGEKIEGLNLGIDRIKKGDKVIVTGDIGDHGVSILCSRNNLIDDKIPSDCAPLVELLNIIKEYREYIKIMRDPTRGGVATTLNEFAKEEEYSIEIWEDMLPINEKVKGVCELLGIDPLYSANEGKALIVVDEKICKEFLYELKRKDIFKHSKVIGEVIDYTGYNVLLKTSLGSRRILDSLSYDILPRIC